MKKMTSGSNPETKDETDFFFKEGDNNLSHRFPPKTYDVSMNYEQLQYESIIPW